MKKKNKLSLSDLKVKSFITDLEKTDQNILKGGAAKTLPANQCISGMIFSACETCGIVCHQD